MSNLMGVSQRRFDVALKGATFVEGRPDHILPFLSKLRTGHFASGSREFHTIHLIPIMQLGTVFGDLCVHTY